MYKFNLTMTSVTEADILNAQLSSARATFFYRLRLHPSIPAQIAILSPRGIPYLFSESSSDV